MSNWFRFGYKKSDNIGMGNFHTHRDFEIFYFHEGSTRFLIQHHIFYIEPGDILLLNGLTKHRSIPLSSHANVRTTVEFFPEYIEPVLKSIQATELLNLFQALNNSVIRVKDKALLGNFEHYISKLNTLLHNTSVLSRNSESLLESQVKNVVVELLFEIYHLSRVPLSEITTEKSKKDCQMEKMLAWITEHYMEKLNMERLSQEFNLNKHYISHLFREIVGMTAMEYVMNCRVDGAKFMLEMMPDKKISDISIDVGFECSAHFSRYFRSKVGMTPSSFRKRRLSNNDKALS